METSLRYDGQSKSLRIHAKEKFYFSSDAFLQVHGELDTKNENNSHCSAIFRYASPRMCLGVGMKYNKHDNFRYTMHGKKTFSLTDDGLLNFKIKARGDVDGELKKTNERAAAEFTWSKLNFQPDQDITIKVGYEITEQVSYAQIRENNWALNFDNKGRWNLRFDL